MKVFPTMPVVSVDLAITPEDELKNIETDEMVEDPREAAAAKTGDRLPDPLTKTDDESFIPVSAETVKVALVFTMPISAAWRMPRRMTLWRNSSRWA